MIIEQLKAHTRSQPLFMGVTKHGGQKLVFYGWSRGHVMRKEKEWLEANAEKLNQLQHGRPALRLVASN